MKRAKGAPPPPQHKHTYPLDVLHVPHIHGVVIVHSCHLVVVLIIGDGDGVRVLGIVRVSGHVAESGSVSKGHSTMAMDTYTFIHTY